MSNPNSCACFVSFKVTWLPCPSKTNKGLLVKNIQPKIKLFEKRLKLFGQEKNHSCSLLHCHVGPWFAKYDVIIL
jgi:hypothetical protein